MSTTPKDFFTEEVARGYDERNAKLSPVLANLHFLMRLLLKDLPKEAKILSVGAGTGAEILFLAPLFPQWTFVALDPSNSMLEICRQRTQACGIYDRCEFVHGYVESLPTTTKFDAALSMLVGHFLSREQRPVYFQEISNRLNGGGTLINAEISFDFRSPEYSLMLKGWQELHRSAGATEEALAALPAQLKSTLTVLSPTEIKGLISQNGFEAPLKFFQSLMICAWSTKKCGC